MATLSTPPRHRPRSTRATTKTKFAFSFFKKNWGGEKRKKTQRQNFGFCVFAKETPKQQTKTSFIAYAISFVVSPFLRELWRYAPANLRERSPTRNTSHWHSLRS